ncbi:MAG: single-stranded DNA-binding protein [Waterburya sp.]
MSNTQDTTTKTTSLNSILVSEVYGRVGSEPVVKTTKNGKNYTEFLLAQQEDYSGQVNWITVIAWSNEKVEKDVQYTTTHLKKGSLVRLQNFRITANSWVYEEEAYTRMEAHLNSNRQLKFLSLAKSA